MDGTTHEARIMAVGGRRTTGVQSPAEETMARRSRVDARTPTSNLSLWNAAAESGNPPFNAKRVANLEDAIQKLPKRATRKNDDAEPFRTPVTADVLSLSTKD
jgi:hypothetical protein